MRKSIRKVSLILLTVLFAASQIFSGKIVTAETVETSNQIQSASKVRLSGNDRYKTSAAISKSGWTSSQYAILARGDNFADALCAGPLAKKLGAPILLTQTGSLNADTLSEIKRLGASKIILVGGTGAISQNVENQIKLLGNISTERVYGKDRYETSVKIAQEIGSTDSIGLAVGSNYADALSFSPIAALKGIPILLTNKNALPETVKKYIGGTKVSCTYVIGGTGAISKNVENSVPSPLRITGTNRYETNVEIIKTFSKDLNLNNIYFAVGDGTKGSEFADALSGSALASKTSSPVLLVYKSLSPSTKNYIDTKFWEINKITVLGGQAAVPESISDDILNIVNNPSDALSVKVRVETADKTIIPETVLKVKNFDMSSCSITKQTNKANAMNVLLEVLSKKGTDLKDKNKFEAKLSDYGSYFVNTIDGITASNTGGWMYCINDASPANSMENQEVKDKDSIVIYYVPNYFTAYSFFDKSEVNTSIGKSVTLNLKGLYYNADFTVNNKAISGAKIYVNGKEAKNSDGTNIITDADGNCTLKFDAGGNYDITADLTDKSGNHAISRPYSKVTIKDYDSKVNSLIDGISKNIKMSDWALLDLKQSGKTIPSDSLQKLENKITSSKGVSDSVTDCERTVIAVLSAGGDPTNIGGYNLTEKIYNGSMSSINEYVYGLLALDSRNFTIPQDAKWGRKNLVKAVLDAKISTGGWAYSGSVMDPDMTAMVLSALAPYKSDADVKTAIDTAIAKLSSVQTADGGFSSWGSENSCSIASVLIGLCDNGVDPVSDIRFIKNGNNIMDALLKYTSDDNSGFIYTLKKAKDDYSTEQGFRALAAYNLFKQGKGSVYKNLTAVQN